MSILLTGNFSLNKLSNFYRRLEDAISQRESEKREKLEKWKEVTERISVINVDTHKKLRNIKEKNPHTTPEIQEQLEAIQVKIFIAQQLKKRNVVAFSFSYFVLIFLSILSVGFFYLVIFSFFSFCISLVLVHLIR